MTESRPDPHASDADHGHDDHAHPAHAPGRVDLPAWGAGLLGVLLGLAVVAALAIATGALG